MAGHEPSLELSDAEICVGWTKFWSERCEDEIILGHALSYSPVLGSPPDKQVSVAADGDRIISALT